MSMNKNTVSYFGAEEPHYKQEIIVTIYVSKDGTKALDKIEMEYKSDLISDKLVNKTIISLADHIKKYEQKEPE